MAVGRAGDSLSLSLVASGGWKCRDFPLQATPPLYANAVAPQADASLVTAKQFHRAVCPCLPWSDSLFSGALIPKMRVVSCFLLFLIRGDAVLPFSLGVTLAHMLNPKTCVTLDMLVVFTNGSFFWWKIAWEWTSDALLVRGSKGERLTGTGLGRAPPRTNWSVTRWDL